MGRSWLGMMVIVAWLMTWQGPALAAAAAPGYWLDIDLDSATMRLMHGERLVRAYHAALGRGGLGKQIRGDNKTPVGRYHIVAIRPSDRFRTFMHLSYPNQDDINKAYGRGVLDWSEYERLLEGMARSGVAPQNSPLGGFVGVHGMGTSDPVLLNYHKTHNWTNGCVALTDREIDDLASLLDVGTVVVIHSNRIAPDTLLARPRVPVLPFGDEDTLLGLSRGPGPAGVSLQGVSLGLYGDAWRLPTGFSAPRVSAVASSPPTAAWPARPVQPAGQRVAALPPPVTGTAGHPMTQGGLAPAADSFRLSGNRDTEQATVRPAVQLPDQPTPRFQLPQRQAGKGFSLVPRPGGWGGSSSKPLLGSVYSPSP